MVVKKVSLFHGIRPTQDFFFQNNISTKYVITTVTPKSQYESQLEVLERQFLHVEVLKILLANIILNLNNYLSAVKVNLILIN